MKAYLSILIILVLAVCFGCQDVFTYSPLDFLERDPSTLSKEQQLLYARQALSSGDDSAMNKALNIVVNELIPADPTNPDLWLLGGDLKWTLSHAPIALQNYLFANNNQFPAPASYGAFLTDIEAELSSAEKTLMRDAADTFYYTNAEQNFGATLHAIQLLATGIGLLSAGDPYLNATAYLDAAIAALTP